MNLSYFAKSAIILLAFTSTASASIIHCKSRNSEEKVAMDIQIDGSQAILYLDFNGQQEAVISTVQPWQSLPNRCASIAKGLQFQFSHPHLRQLQTERFI